jgi:hypothetical protein
MARSSVSASYNGPQPATGTVSGATKKYLYDASGYANHHHRLDTSVLAESYRHDRPVAYQPSQIDDFGTPAKNGHGEKLAFAYTPVGLEASKRIAKADGGACRINEQAVTLWSAELCPNFCPSQTT